MQRNLCRETATRSALPWPGGCNRSARWVRGSVVGLGLLVVLVAGEKCAAQASHRLSVRPHEMATGTQNARAGEQQLDSLGDFLVYVPPRAVGTRRVPLIVVVPGGGYNAKTIMVWHRPLADKYGMIVLATSYVYNPEVADEKDLDAALRQVLRKFAIDPDKIALTGSSDGANYTVVLGPRNLDVFSRIAWTSAAPSPPVPQYPPNTTTRFFFSGGGLGEALPSLRVGRVLRQAGHPVEQVLVLKGHQQRLEDYDHMWSWFQESWGLPRPAGYAVPRVVAAAPTPVLTADVITRMAAFWARFERRPYVVQTFGRNPGRQQQVTVPVGEEQLSLRMVDMTMLAAKYPPVAADLKNAGLTAQQHDAYRIAIISAQATQMAMDEGWIEPVAATSVLAKNMAVLRAYGKLPIATGAIGWYTP